MALAQLFDWILCLLLCLGDDVAALLRRAKISQGCVNGCSEFHIFGLLNFGGDSFWAYKWWVQLLQQFLLFEVDLRWMQARLIYL